MIEREEERSSSVPPDLSESLDPRGSLWLDTPKNKICAQVSGPLPSALFPPVVYTSLLLLWFVVLVLFFFFFYIKKFLSRLL